MIEQNYDEYDGKYYYGHDSDEERFYGMCILNLKANILHFGRRRR